VSVSGGIETVGEFYAAVTQIKKYVEKLARLDDLL
jgi:hypothetical protein